MSAKGAGDDAPVQPESPFKDFLGYQIAVWRQDHAEVTLRVEPEHMNRSGIVHGGVLLSLLDAAGGFAGCYTAPGETPRLSMTLSLSSTFVSPARAGELRAIGRRTGGGKRTYFARIEIFDEAQALVAAGDGVFRYRHSAPGYAAPGA